MGVSVIIPSYGMNDYGPTLGSVIRQEVPPEEIIVVKNGFAGLETFRDNTKILYFKEFGLNFARNKGILGSSQDIVAFIDDDAIADPKWVREIAKAHQELDAPAIGGKVEPIWPNSEKPPWIEGVLLDYLSLLDYSSSIANVHPLDWLAGTNISFKRHIFEKAGMFDESLDRRGNCLLSSGEEELCRRIRDLDKEIIYYPDMVVRHVIPESRLSPDYFISRAYWQGVSDFLMDAKSLQEKALSSNVESFKIRNKFSELNLDDLHTTIISLCSVAHSLGYVKAYKGREIKK